MPSAEQAAGVHTCKHLPSSALQTVGSASVAGPVEAL